MSIDPLDTRLAEVTARIERDRLKRFDYADPSSWQKARDSRGQIIRDVLMSICGRYIVLRFWRPGEATPAFEAFRRHGSPEHEKWAPPSWCQVYPSLEDARQGCAEHARREVKP